MNKKAIEKINERIAIHEQLIEAYKEEKGEWSKEISYHRRLIAYYTKRKEILSRGE